uniref:Phenazine biosynthesis like protein domain containing n=1 Tax=Sarcophilus harrisii TaxID=9305 RepID=A0A7N4PFH9_SARHA
MEEKCPVTKPGSEVPALKELDEETHQKIAREMNLSETAFIQKLHPSDNFTQKNVNQTVTFVTLSGELKARQAEDGIIMDLPLYPTQPKDVKEVQDLIKVALCNVRVQDVRYSPDTKKLLVRIDDSYGRSFLENLEVNASNLTKVENTGKVRGLILTLKGEGSGKPQGYDFYSRYFAPWVGVAEDPVTGSAHAVLSSYWSQQLGKKEMRAFQCSRRGGEMKVSLRDGGRIDITGQTALVLEGKLTI